MIMSDTCTTHRSRVPRRSSGRIKGGATTVEDERAPGLYFILCLFILLLKCLNVRQFPPTSSRSTNCVKYIYFI